MTRGLSLLFLVIGLWVCPGSAFAQDQRRDGNYWREMPKAAKLDYITGLFDGMQLGHHFSYWTYTGEQKNNEIVAGAIASYKEYSERYLHHLTNGQLVDGLDAFYTDFQNRRIKVYYAVWLVMNQIAGNNKVDEMILNFRRNPGN